MRVLCWCGVVAGLLGLGGITLAAQERPTVSGQVVDITGAVLPSAAVTARRSSGLVVDAVVCDAAGQFVLRLAEPGDYTISAQHEGFAVTETTIMVNARPLAALELRLRPGGLAEELTVI
ncbi:MAG: carboxypeptidase-like regulatory domain-containing protein, partial [Acidobacteriota bacterium]|nr:carboxypeptidase-like regulatory domain-containing protein [Acidobacteriota bacterium]